MISNFLKINLFILLILAIVVVTNGQEMDSCPHLRDFPDKQQLSESVKERLVKLCIEEQKKEFEELVQRTETVAKLSEEIETSYEENKTLSAEDKDKLKTVEEMVNKIRKELQADDDDDEKDDEDKPVDTLEAIKKLKESTSQLLDEIKKTTRHSISAAAIQSSNTVKKIIKFLRFGK